MVKQKVLMIAVGGATCSGKTLLAKHIARVLPTGSSLIIHQDDFAPSQDLIPFKNGVQDWDTPSTAILWPLFNKALKYAKQTGKWLEEVNGHDHLNKQVEVPVDEAVVEGWRDRIQEVVNLAKDEEGVEWKFVLVDGFLLYWDEEATNTYDIRLFLRVPHDVLKARREERAQYVTQNPLLAEAGEVWSDPPNYFSEIVYPAYVEAHTSMFEPAKGSEEGDVETGEFKDEWIASPPEGKGLKVLQPVVGSKGMESMLVDCLGLIWEGVKKGL